MVGLPLDNDPSATDDGDVLVLVKVPVLGSNAIPALDKVPEAIVAELLSLGKAPAPGPGAALALGKAPALGPGAALALGNAPDEGPGAALEFGKAPALGPGEALAFGKAPDDGPGASSLLGNAPDNGLDVLSVSISLAFPRESMGSSTKIPSESELSRIASSGKSISEMLTSDASVLSSAGVVSASLRTG